MKNKLRISVASRLYMGFAAVCVGVLIIALGSLISMAAIQTRIDIIVNEVAPAENALARLQTESMNLSRLVSLYFNERDLQELTGLKTEYQTSRSAYLEFEAQLLKRISQFPEFTSVQAELNAMSEDVASLLNAIETSMASYEQSLRATQSIEEKRTTLIELNKELESALKLFVQDTFDPSGKELVYEVKSLIERGGSLAIQLSFASNLVDFQDAQELFRTFLDDYGLLGFRMLGFARSDEFFERNMQDVTELTSELIETVTLEGGIGPIQNEYLQLRASLNIRLSEIQHAITDKVKALNQIAEQISAVSETASEEAKTSREKARLTIIIVTGVVIVLSILIGFLVAQSIRRPLNKLHRFIHNVGGGDLRTTLGQYSNDEIGDISRAMDELVTELRHVVIGIAEQSEAVNNVASKTSELTDLTMSKSQQQQQEIEQSVHSIGEMSSSIKEVAHTAEHTSQQMQAGEAEAQSIQTNISSTVRSVSDLNEKMQGAVNVIQALDDSLGSIESILETIQTIAEQTNLLALNAAIEAARAGEQGRGFAVVADEVRTLATRTQQSTEEIREKINGVQAQSKSAVDAITQSQGSTTELTQTAQTAGADFDRFVAEIRNLSEANMSIAAAAEQQSMTTEQMSQLMQTINELSAQTTGIIQQVSAGILSLNSVSQDLNKAVHQFKT